MRDRRPRAATRGGTGAGKRRSPVAKGVGLLAPAGILAACVPSEPEEPGPGTGSPSTELDVFYEQELAWEDCTDYPTTAGEAGLLALAPTAECARMEVPLDYEEPEGELVSAAVILAEHQPNHPWMKDPEPHLTKSAAMVTEIAMRSIADLCNEAQRDVLFRAHILLRNPDPEGQQGSRTVDSLSRMTFSPPDPAAGTDETRIPGGPGWYMDALTLLPVIEDIEEFRGANAEDRALPLLTELWSGRPGKAEPIALALVRDEPTFRHRALLADVRRDLGRTAWAVAEYTELIEQCRGTAREAVMWQHLGKAHFVGRDYPKAAEAFERALDLRLRDTASEDLVASSRMALQRARTLIADLSR